MSVRERPAGHDAAPARVGDVVAGLVVAALLAVAPLLRLPESRFRGRRDETVASVLPPLVLDPNHAPEGLLVALPGVGPVLASRIVAERAHMPFDDAAALLRVHGLGPQTLRRLRAHVRFGPPRELAPTGAADPGARR